MRILGLFILWFSFITVQAQFDEQTVADFDLNKGVKTLKISRTTSVDQRETGSYEIYYFDKKGQISKVEFFDKGEQQGTGHYTFSDNGELVSIRAVEADGTDMGLMVDNTVTDGRIMIRNQPMAGKKVVYAYDDEGNKIKEEEFYGDKLRVGYSFEYDDDGNMTRKIRLLPDGTENYEFRYKYDDKGNQIEQNGYYQGKFNDGWVYVYDDEGNRIEEHHKGDDGEVYASFIYNFDKEGHLLSKIEKDKSGNVKSRIIYEYNKHGHVIKEEKYGFDNQLVISSTLNYEYDSNDNWLEKEVFQNDELASITVREITYYD